MDETFGGGRGLGDGGSVPCTTSRAAIGMGRGGKRFNLELGVLEAQSGLTPAIGLCKTIAEARSRRRGGDAEAGAKLEAMRAERVRRTIHKVRREVQRAAKKARTFAVQRLIRRLRAVDAAKRAPLEERMRVVKAIDLAVVGERLLAEQVVGQSAYLAERLGAHVKTAPGDDAAQAAALSAATLDRQLGAIRDELTTFLRTLYHESLPAAKEALEADGTAASCFVTLDGGGGGGGTVPPPAKRQRGAKGAPRVPKWEEEGGGRLEEADRSTGNRKGQRARRIEWERKFGQAARHLAKGPSVAPRLKSDAPRSRPGAHQRGTRRSGAQAGGAAAPAVEEKLHPSWEAQRRQREALRAAAGGQPANSRIVFDE